jgi:hypothetical protein
VAVAIGWISVSVAVIAFRQGPPIKVIKSKSGYFFSIPNNIPELYVSPLFCKGDQERLHHPVPKPEPHSLLKVTLKEFVPPIFTLFFTLFGLSMLKSTPHAWWRQF